MLVHLQKMLKQIFPTYPSTLYIFTPMTWITKTLYPSAPATMSHFRTQCGAKCWPIPSLYKDVRNQLFKHTKILQGFHVLVLLFTHKTVSLFSFKHTLHHQVLECEPAATVTVLWRHTWCWERRETQWTVRKTLALTLQRPFPRAQMFAQSHWLQPTSLKAICVFDGRI